MKSKLRDPSKTSAMEKFGQVSRAITLLGIVGLSLALVLSPALAEPAAVAIDDRAPSLDKREGGGWTASLGFTNLTDQAITVAAKPANSTDEGCSLALDKPELPQAQHSTVKVTVPAGCEVDDDGFDFDVTAAAEATQLATFDVTAAPKPPGEEPQWGVLRGFPIVLGAMVAGVIALYMVWDTVDAQQHRPTQPLKYLDSSWSFKDSWVSNITVLGGLLTGLFGTSGIVEALVGDEGAQELAVATVGGAIAIAFAAAGPIVLVATKSRRNAAYTVFGFLASSALVLTGAFGQLWVMSWSGQEIIGGWEPKLWLPAGAAAVLLLIYSVRTIVETLETGTTKPKKPPAGDAIVAAKMIVEVLKAKGDINANDADKALDDIYPGLSKVKATSLGDEPAVRRSALL